MRLLIIFLCLSILAQAQDNKEKSIRLHLLKKAKIIKEQPIRFHLYGTYGMPIGNSYNKSNDIFVTGQGVEGGGINYVFSIPVYKKWHLGVSCSYVDYKLKEKAISEQMYQRYASANYITEEDATYTYGSMSNAYLGLVVSRIQRLLFFELEPSISVGTAFFGTKGRGKIRQHNIQANDVEFINISHKLDNNITIYGSAGLRLNVPFPKWERFSGSIGIFYTTTSNLKPEFTATRVDFYGNEQIEEQFTVSNNVSAYHLDIGLQLRLWRDSSKDND